MLRIFLYGAGTGALVSLVLYLLMYVAARDSHIPTIVFSVARVLWPSSFMLMAVQNSGQALFGLTVFAVAVLSNALLYAVVAVVAWLVLRRVGGV